MQYPVLDSWQFRISEAPDGVPFGPMFLQIGEGLVHIPVKDCNGTSVGHLLGFPIDLQEQCLLTAGRALQTTHAADNMEHYVEQLFERLAGRFILLIDHGDDLRAYPDGSAQVPCVFAPSQRLVASTAHAIWAGTDYDQRLNSTLFEQLHIQGEGWFPAGLTAHEALYRVLPNHYLDLKTWQVHRHWPKEEWDICDDPHQVTQELTDLVRQQVSILLQGGQKVAQAMTAGRETRALLACAKPYAQDLLFVTVSGGQGYQMDTLMARKIITDLGHAHRALAVRNATDAEHARYMHRGGHCVGDTNALTHPSVWPLKEEGYCFVGGSGGEVGRAFFWRPSDRADMSFAASDLITRMGLPAAPPLMAQMEHWVQELPTQNALLAMDLAYIEHRMGAWGGTQFCSDPTVVRFAPLVNRRAIQLLLSLPEDWKRSSRLFEDILQRNAPELMSYPFNSMGPLRDQLSKVQRVLRNPQVVRKKIRKLFG